MQPPSSNVSVIIPTYNRAHFICDAIESVLQQAGDACEVLVVDDGSTDDTRSMLGQRYGDRLRYVYQENAGPAAARNAGVRLARGRYVGFLDSDDMWLAGKLEKQVRALDDNPACGAVCGNILSWDPVTDRKELRRKPACGKSGWIWPYVYRNPWRYHFLYLETTLFRKQLLLDVGLFDESRRIAEDWHLTFRVVAVTRVITDPEPVAITRLHAGQISLGPTCGAHGSTPERSYWSGDREQPFIDMAKQLQARFAGLTPAMRMYLGLGIGRGYCRMGARHLRRGRLKQFVGAYANGLARNPVAAVEIMVALIRGKPRNVQRSQE